MNKKEPGLLRTIWEAIPDPDCQEHLRRVFEILLAASRKEFDEHTGRKQDESAADNQPSN